MFQKKLIIQTIVMAATSQEIQVRQHIMSKVKYVKAQLEWVLSREIVESRGFLEKITSPVFKVKVPGETSSWNMVLYPKDCSNSSSAKEGVSLFLNCGTLIENAKEMMIHSSLSIKTGDHLKKVLYQGGKEGSTKTIAVLVSY